MQICRTLIAAFACLAVASTAPALAQDPHDHNATGQSVTTACAPQKAVNGMHGGMEQMPQGMEGQHMMQMMQSMEQMRSEMQRMHNEMTQMRQEMLHRRTK